MEGYLLTTMEYEFSIFLVILKSVISVDLIIAKGICYDKTLCTCI